MFDFGQIIDTVKGFMGDNVQPQDLAGGDLAESPGGAVHPALTEALPLNQAHGFLSEAGIDPSSLALDQAGAPMADTGIDPATLTEGQAGALIQRMTGASGA